MEFSILVAKIIGIIYLSFGIGLLLNSKYYQKVFRKILNDSSYIILGGIIAIIIGVIIINEHNIWISNWTVIITIIGWVALIKGILLLAFPKFTNVFEKLLSNKKRLPLLGVFAVIFGLLFIYFGFSN